MNFGHRSNPRGYPYKEWVGMIGSLILHYCLENCATITHSSRPVIDIMAPSAAETVKSSLPDASASSATTSYSLRITIIGAGIAGLSAAIGLRRAGHTVTV